MNENETRVFAERYLGHKLTDADFRSIYDAWNEYTMEESMESFEIFLEENVIPALKAGQEKLL